MPEVDVGVQENYISLANFTDELQQVHVEIEGTNATTMTVELEPHSCANTFHGEMSETYEVTIELERGKKAAVEWTVEHIGDTLDAKIWDDDFKILTPHYK